MAKHSAAVLLFRRSCSTADSGANPTLEVLLVHPGGPFWRNKDLGAWTLPKGEYGEGEDPLAAARREFAEETGHEIDGKWLSLGSITQRGGKIVTAWAVEGELDSAEIRSNTFLLEWPPRSGKQQVFPEIDRAEWLPVEAARTKLIPAQTPFLERLCEQISAP